MHRFGGLRYRIPTRSKFVYTLLIGTQGILGTCNLAGRTQIQKKCWKRQCRLQHFQTAVTAPTLWLQWQKKLHSKLLVQNAYINHTPVSLICLIWTCETYHGWPTGHTTYVEVFKSKKGLDWIQQQYAQEAARQPSHWHSGVNCETPQTKRGSICLLNGSKIVQTDKINAPGEWTVRLQWGALERGDNC